MFDSCWTHCYLNTVVGYQNVDAKPYPLANDQFIFHCIYPSDFKRLKKKYNVKSLFSDTFLAKTLSEFGIYYVLCIWINLFCNFLNSLVSCLFPLLLEYFFNLMLALERLISHRPWIALIQVVPLLQGLGIYWYESITCCKVLNSFSLFFLHNFEGIPRGLHEYFMRLLDGSWGDTASSWMSLSFTNSCILLLLNSAPLLESWTSGFTFVSYMLANAGIILSPLVGETKFACGNIDA